MSKIEWERDLVERPFCRQLQAMGWEWIEGDPDLPESTERTSSQEVLLRGRLAAAIRRRRFVGELKRGDGADFPDLDPRIQVPFVRLVLDFCGAQGESTDAERKRAMPTTLEMVDRITQEIRSVGFWKKANARELLTRRLVRDLDEAGIGPPETQRDLAQRLVALARENHENLTR